MTRMRNLAALACLGFAASSVAQEWYIERETDPILDTKNVYAYLDDPNDSSRYLFIRCQQQRLDAFINWGVADTLSPQTGQTDVTVRLDQNQPEVWKMLNSTDNSATFIIEPEEFVKALPEHEQLAVRADTALLIVTMVFDLTKVGPVVQEVLEACGLTP